MSMGKKQSIPERHPTLSLSRSAPYLMTLHGAADAGTRIDAGGMGTAREDCDEA